MKKKISPILEAIRKEVPEFPVMPESNLKEVHKALFGKMDHDREYRPPTEKKAKAVTVVLARESAPKEVQELMAVAENFGAHVFWMKTGLSVKVVNEGGYTLNVMNFLNVRVRDGEVSGDMYLNQIRSERLAEPLKDMPDYGWFKGYMVVKSITASEVLSLMTEDNMTYLVGMGEDALNSKKAKAKSLKVRMK